MNKKIKTRDYWFALKSHVYTKFGGGYNLFLYDTETGNSLGNTDKEVYSLISQLYEHRNIGVTLLPKELLEQSGIRDFVIDILDKNMGDLMPVEVLYQKTVRLFPILNLQNDIEKLRKNGIDLTGENLLNYLLDLNLYINDSCPQNCRLCEKQYQQVLSCTKGHSGAFLSIGQIKIIARQIQYAPLRRINITGGNVLDYEYLNDLKEVFANAKCPVNYYLNYKNINVLPVGIENIVLLVNFPVEGERIKEALAKTATCNTLVHFIVESEEQYFEAEDITEKYNIERSKVFPFYNGMNTGFFKDYVYLRKEDILSKKLSIREIFRNQKLNSNYFGTLHIFPDGQVRADSSSDILGNIYDSTILEMLHKEMQENTAWRKVRNSEPCCQCLYQFLCPAPGNYEKATGIPNMCHVL